MELRIIEREECYICGREVRGNQWACGHPFTNPAVTGQRQEARPTVKRRYQELPGYKVVRRGER